MGSRLGLSFLRSRRELSERLSSLAMQFAATEAAPVQIEYNNLGVDVRRNLAGTLCSQQGLKSYWMGPRSTSTIQSQLLLMAEPG